VQRPRRGVQCETTQSVAARSSIGSAQRRPASQAELRKRAVRWNRYEVFRAVCLVTCQHAPHGFARRMLMRDAVGRGPAT